MNNKKPWLIVLLVLFTGPAAFSAGKKAELFSRADVAAIKKIEPRLRGAYLDIFQSSSNPVAAETAGFLKEHPEISFRIGLTDDETALNWCNSKGKTVYTDSRYLKKYWRLGRLAGNEKVFRSFIRENAAFIAHELTHMRISFEWPYYKLDPVKLGRRPLTAEWNLRYSNAGEYLAYLVEQTYVGFEMARTPRFVSRMANPSYKWRWEYYSADPEKYCRKVLNIPCSEAGLEDIKEPLYPELDDYYKSKIQQYKVLRAELLSRKKH
ncbi:MAG: hypothetical protein NTX59_08580 [Elusimicrobia bacterium]|nr:hypothetical protein [Elusimicrobiota bacterium]